MLSPQPVAPEGEGKGEGGSDLAQQVDLQENGPLCGICTGQNGAPSGHHLHAPVIPDAAGFDEDLWCPPIVASSQCRSQASHRHPGTIVQSFRKHPQPPHGCQQCPRPTWQTQVTWPGLQHQPPEARRIGFNFARPHRDVLLAGPEEGEGEVDLVCAEVRLRDAPVREVRQSETRLPGRSGAKTPAPADTEPDGCVDMRAQGNGRRPRFRVVWGPAVPDPQSRLREKALGHGPVDGPQQCGLRAERRAVCLGKVQRPKRRRALSSPGPCPRLIRRASPTHFNGQAATAQQAGHLGAMWRHLAEGGGEEEESGLA